MTNGVSFPTILVAANSGVRHELVRRLRQQGYLVLEAEDSVEALEIVRVHSRPIHLMLTGESMDSRTFAATLRQYRPYMRVLFLARNAQESSLDALAPELMKVRELLEPPGARS